MKVGTAPNNRPKVRGNLVNSIALPLASNVDQNAASLERLDGVRILVNGWRASERLQPKTNRRYF
jgi:hypothetical protein